ncbi:MAG: HIT domain-containing protein [Magnetospiraceae bacterium]
MSFQLHRRLAADTLPHGDLHLCALRIMNDRRYPWIILVPRRAGVEGLHALSAEDQAQLISEVTSVSQVLEDAYTPTRVNVAALGNMVPQLHVHVIARFEGDSAWPGPVWGVGEPLPYAATDPALKTLQRALQDTI